MIVLYQPFQNRTIPRKSPTPLPPLPKGGGLTARHKPLYCCFLLVPRTPFLFAKPFCRQDGGIATPLRSAPTLPKTALSLAFRNANICMHLYAFTSALSHPLFVGRGACPSRCTNHFHSHNLPKTRTIPLAFLVVSTTAPLPTKIKSAPVFTGANSSSH